MRGWRHAPNSWFDIMTLTTICPRRRSRVDIALTKKLRRSGTLTYSSQGHAKNLNIRDDPSDCTG